MLNIIGKAGMYCVLCDMLLVFDVILQISLSWTDSASCHFKICSSSSCHITVMLKILN